MVAFFGFVKHFVPSFFLVFYFSARAVLFFFGFGFEVFLVACADIYFF